MRNFNFGETETANTSAANIEGLRPVENELPAESLRLNEAEREEVREDVMSTFRNVSMDDDEDTSDRTFKIAGGVFAALLLVGGSAYAYYATTVNHAPQTASVAPAKPQNVAAAQPVTPPISTPDANLPSTPSAANTPPAASAPKPASMPRSGLAMAAPAPVAPDAAAPSASAPVNTASADPAINAPMTLTPETAPAPQQSAMAQPITAPNVSQSGQPTSEVANNAPSGVTMPSATVQPNLTAPSQSTDASAPSAPAQAQPAAAPSLSEGSAAPAQ